MLLESVNVVEWSNDIASQFSARLLGDLGANVIKFEPIGGDAIRRRAPFWSGSKSDSNASVLFDFLNAGKRCRQIDPGCAEDVEAVKQAIGKAAIFVQSNFDSAFAATGLTVASLREQFPQLVVLSITPFGLGIEPSEAPDFILQHHAGLAHATARPVSDPEAQPPLVGADHEGPLAVGVSGALSAVWGLLVADSGEKAPEIDLATQDVYAQVLIDDFVQWGDGKRHFSRDRKDSPSIAPAGGISWLLPASDGFIMVSPREEHQWQRWMAVLGQPEWAQDAELCGSVAVRKENWSRLRELMAEWSKQLPAGELAAKAQQEKVACFPVSTPAELLRNAQLHARRFFDFLVGPADEQIRIPGLPFLVTDTSGRQLERERVLSVPGAEAQSPRFAE
jgi:crotonobetainyl-CoA:carnitine CoA-transferase CaiB-like acyl-CoA transferase